MPSCSLPLSRSVCVGILLWRRGGDLELFTRLARLEEKGRKVDTPAQLPLRVVIPAFVTSELKTAFLMGSSGKPARPNFAVFDNYIVEPAFLTGMIAAGMSKSGQIGLVAGRIYSCRRGQRSCH